MTPIDGGIPDCRVVEGHGKLSSTRVEIRFKWCGVCGVSVNQTCKICEDLNIVC